jgi:hypothetical protein
LDSIRWISGNTPPVSPPQGNAGGNGATPCPSFGAAGGGGGAGAVGGNAIATWSKEVQEQVEQDQIKSSILEQCTKVHGVCMQVAEVELLMEGILQLGVRRNRWRWSRCTNKLVTKFAGSCRNS